MSNIVNPGPLNPFGKPNEKYQNFDEFAPKQEAIFKFKHIETPETYRNLTSEGSITMVSEEEYQTNCFLKEHAKEEKEKRIKNYMEIFRENQISNNEPYRKNIYWEWDNEKQLYKSIQNDKITLTAEALEGKLDINPIIFKYNEKEGTLTLNEQYHDLKLTTREYYIKESIRRFPGTQNKLAIAHIAKFRFDLLNEVYKMGRNLNMLIVAYSSNPFEEIISRAIQLITTFRERGWTYKSTIDEECSDINKTALKNAIIGSNYEEEKRCACIFHYLPEHCEKANNLCAFSIN